MTEEQQTTTTEPTTAEGPKLVCFITMQINLETVQALMSATGSSDPREAIFAATGHCLMLDQFKRETTGEDGRLRHVELVRESARVAGILPCDSSPFTPNESDPK